MEDKIIKTIKYLVEGPFVGLVVGESVGALNTFPIMTPPYVGSGVGCDIS